MKGKLIKYNNTWYVETFDLYKTNHPTEVELLECPRNFVLKEGKEVEFEVIEVEDYVGFAGHTAYPTFTSKAVISAKKE